MSQVQYRNQEIDGLNIFYREAGQPGNPALLLLHGWPSSSHMFRDLIPKLADRFHVIAPDYPGFGYSAAPLPDAFKYSFDNFSLIIEKLLGQLSIEKVSLYMQDYGGPVGFRLAVRRPQLINAMIVQNAVAHEEGLADSLKPLRDYWKDRSAKNEEVVRGFLSKDTTVFQYTHGAGHPERISPDSYHFDQSRLDRPGNDRIQLELFYDYKSNPEQYDQWQSYLQTHRPPMLIAWGKNDPFFTVAGAEALQRDNPNATLKLLNAGHFALEEASDEIAACIHALADRVQAQSHSFSHSV